MKNIFNNKINSSNNRNSFDGRTFMKNIFDNKIDSFNNSINGFDNGTFRILFNNGQLKEYESIHDVSIALNVSSDIVISWFTGTKVPDKKYNICDLKCPEWFIMI